MNHVAEAPWTTGLFDCFSDSSSCCLTLWCPCIAFGQIAELIDKGEHSRCAYGTVYLLLCWIGCCGLYSKSYRSKMRKQFKLKGSHCWDFWIHFCCEPCSLSQEYRELQNLGFDLSDGKGRGGMIKPWGSCV